MTNGKILEVKNLTINFGKEGEEVVSGLTFDLSVRGNLVIVGPNGAGKTVLIKALLGLVPYNGEIKWKEEIKVGYVPQKFFPPKEIPLSVEEFFSFKKVSRQEVEKALLSVGLDVSVLKKKIGFMSAGQFQRLMIAWSLADNPDVLIFDEPTSGIDVGGEETIYKLLAQIEKELNLTIIMVTHDLSVVYKFADNVLCLNRSAVCYGSPTDSITAEALEQLYGSDVKLYGHKHE